MSGKPSSQTNSQSTRIAGIFQALLVTFLWSTSWVIIKFGLADIPALPFAGLRYFIAFLCLLPFAFTRKSSAAWKKLSGREWVLLGVLGLIYYALTQGTQFLSLTYLPAMTASLILNFTTSIVALSGIVLLSERPSALQWIGVIINLGGILIYFFPVDLPSQQAMGVLIAIVGVIANAGSSLLGRYINRMETISPLQVTIVSMGIGSALLLIAGVITQGFPELSLTNWMAILWLAVVNTAIAFTLWNRTLRVLSAMESSIINSTMLIQIAVLAWIFLGERVNWQEGIGMALAAAGVMIVQIRKKG
ncbi:MAG: DMT family transporter [Anaerolineales bacterium]